MEIVLKKNEAEINETVARGLLVVFGVVLLTYIFGWIGIFDIFPDMTIILLVAAFVTLVLPAVLILKFRFYSTVMKYVIVAAAAVMAGTAYVLFTFQAVIIFVIPTLIAGCYLNKRLLCFSGGMTIAAILIAHVITGYYLRQPWIEPFWGMSAIIRYGAIPRCLQYLACFCLIWFFTDRYSRILLQTLPEVDKSREEFEAILRELTEREQSVLMLMIGGYTNSQIADKLCLSNGTVKNYISAIYDKLGTNERNALIMKYHSFFEEYDQSHGKL